MAELLDYISYALSVFVVVMLLLITGGCGKNVSFNELKYDRDKEEVCLHGRLYIHHLKTGKIYPVYIKMPDRSVRVRPCRGRGYRY